MKKRYADGGDVDVDAANKSSDPMGTLMERRKYKGQSFSSAFREARNAGEDTFFWNGKKYTTELAAPRKTEPSGPPGPSGRPRENVAPSGRGAAAGSFEDDKARMADMMRPGRDAIENVYPEQLIGGPGGLGLKSLAGLASRLAGKGKSPGRALAVREAEETPVKFLGASGARDVTPRPRIGNAERPRLEGSASKQLEGPPKRLSTSTRKAEEDVFKGEGESFGLEGAFKKGGKVKAYAKGGMIDGIAQRGKTKCKVV